MRTYEEKIRKKDLLAIRSELTEDGIVLHVKGKSYRIKYPHEVWKEYPDTNKELLLDNLTFMQTCHLPASHRKKGAVYSTSLPCFEPFAFKCTLYDIPSTASIDYAKSTDYLRRFFNSTFFYASYDSVLPEAGKKKSERGNKPTAIILFTAGKESLLTLALCIELGIKPIPIFVEEVPGHPEAKHKDKIISKLKEEYGIDVYKIINEPGKLRYCDLGEKTNNWGAGPQFLSYTLAVMPFVHFFDADYIFFGNEYSCDEYTYDKQGFKSKFWYDQSSECTKQLSSVARIMTNNRVEVGSLVSPLYEIGIIKTLHERYPHLARLQMSCFSDTKKGKDRVWCGNCPKCASVFVFLKSIGVDPKKIGFENNMFNKSSGKHFLLFGKDGFYGHDKSVLDPEEEAFAFFMAAERGEKGYLIDRFKRLSAYRHMKSNAKKMRRKYLSQYENVAIPYGMKEQVMDIFDETLEGRHSQKDFRLKEAKEAELQEITQQGKQ